LIGAPPRPRWRELTAFPRPPNWNKGDLLLRKGEGCRKGKGRRGRKREGVRGDEKGGEPWGCVSLQ